MWAPSRRVVPVYIYRVVNENSNEVRPSETIELTFESPLLRTARHKHSRGQGATRKHKAGKQGPMKLHGGVGYVRLPLCRTEQRRDRR